MANVMVLGSDGRTDALAWWLAQYGHKVFAAPGNGGTALRGRNIDIDPHDFDAVARAARNNRVSLVVPGPEDLLAEGIVDYWWDKDLPSKHNIEIFGPSKSAARLESSKIFGREFAARYGIPIPYFVPFHSGHHATNVKQATVNLGKYIGDDRVGAPLVVKADGLCKGKGVFMTSTPQEAIEAARKLKRFGDAGEDFLLEERLRGEEASVMVFTDGLSFKVMPHSQDHKRRRDNDNGPNTGGMGAYAPTKAINGDMMRKIEREIIRPTLNGLRQEGIDYRGLLYFAVMMHACKPYLLEYNCRFGDPETQAVVPLMDSDPYKLMMATLKGKLDTTEFRKKHGYTCSVVLVHKEYPDKGSRGRRIKLDEVVSSSLDSAVVFHAGTVMRDGKFFTNGGRILAVTGFSKHSPDAAMNRAYEEVRGISFKGMDYRQDIGIKAI
jgi:phosphoribosylamine--glycine ligase